MCGIFGVAAPGGQLAAVACLDRMQASLRHRGPDGSGRLCDRAAALGVTQLRITDPQSPATQPFQDPEGRLWLVGNGEIYNAPALRRRFSGYPYRTQNDLEPLIPLYLERGVHAFEELEGMFAVALWEPRCRRLTLARDRAGEKPLFYAVANGQIWFASEIQALLAVLAPRPPLDRAALRDLFCHGYIVEPRTPFQTIHRVEAGAVRWFAPDGNGQWRYWRPEAIEPLVAPADSAAEDIGRLLEASVAERVRGVARVGIFLSGGIDSSLLAVLAARAAGPTRVRSYTLGFRDPSYDETRWAAAAARHAGIEHRVVCWDDSRVPEALDRIVTRVAEPLVDPAALAVLLLAERAANDVRVVLSGEGADELFGGYPTYIGHRLARLFTALPRPGRALLRGCVSAWPASRRKVTVSYLLKRFVAGADLPPDSRHTAWFGPGLLPPGHPGEDEAADRREAPSLERFMLRDYLGYLRDGLLVKIDRTTMLSSLEARAPYLDRELTEAALALPASLRVRGVTSKWLLKRAARRWLPKGLVGRRKRGLSLPLARLLDTTFRAEVDRLLGDPRKRAEVVQDLLPERRVAQLLGEHRSGRFDHGRALWTLFLWARWREHWLGS